MSRLAFLILKKLMLTHRRKKGNDPGYSERRSA